MARRLLTDGQDSVSSLDESHIRPGSALTLRGFSFSLIRCVRQIYGGSLTTTPVSARGITTSAAPIPKPGSQVSRREYVPTLSAEREPVPWEPIDTDAIAVLLTLIAFVALKALGL